MSWLLIVHHDEEVRLHVKRMITRVVGKAIPSRIFLASNIEEVKSLLRENDLTQCQLVVLGAATPANARSSVGLSGREPTKELVKEIKNLQPTLPLVVLSTTPDDLLAEFLYSFKLWALVTIDASFATQLQERTRELLDFSGAKAASVNTDAHHGIGAFAEPRNGAGNRHACLQLDIELCDERSATYLLRRVGTDAFEKPGVLVMDKREMEDVLYESRQLEKAVSERNSEWLENLKHLSRKLCELLFEGGSENLRCWERFLRHREKVGGIANTRVRLTVNDQTHPILIEALRDQAEETDDYWMLSAPVFRRFRPQSDETMPLFKDPLSRKAEKINCLIIEADGDPGTVPLTEDNILEFEGLKHCRVEAREIKDLLKTSAGGEVRRMVLSRTKHDVQQRVLEVLNKGHWHIVHFCGHVVGNSADGAGIVLRADRDGILPIKRLVHALNRTQLLFLSSCQSASAEIVTQAVEHGVPAVIGFRWKIEDEPASRFAAEFYSRLFDSADRDSYRYVEYAFMKARQAAHNGVGKLAGPPHGKPNRKGGNRHTPSSVPRSNPIWVAPMLVMQLG